MNSIFLRLYFLIVVTILLVGFSLDYIWQNLEAQELENSQIEQLIQSNAILLDKLPKEFLAQQIEQLNQVSDSKYQLFLKNDAEVKGLFDRLTNNELLMTENESQIIGFVKLATHQLVLQYAAQQVPSSAYLKPIFIILFYSIIAVAVFLWIWPLSRDLNRLENAVSEFSEQQWKSKVKLPSTSSVTHLAKAYNTLLDRIKFLIETQQSMSHSISHELRTPLARIRFSLQMAEESENTIEIKNQLVSVMEDVEEMNQLITELLNFAALEKISVMAKLERGNINLLIENLLARLSRNNPNYQLSFKANKQGKHVLCDSYLMERAIQNLVVNACRFARDSIKVSFEESDQQYLIKVEDDGPGIPSTKKSLVFDSFVQLSSNNKEQGFGLGLAIVKRVMNLHRGEATVADSELGGAKFILAWPKSP